MTRLDFPISFSRIHTNGDLSFSQKIYVFSRSIMYMYNNNLMIIPVQFIF